MRDLFQSFKGIYPYIICDGFFGAGISTKSNLTTPFFYMKSFEGEKELLFQPAHYFRYSLPDKPSLSLIPIKKRQTSSKRIKEAIKLFKETPLLEKVVLAKKKTYTFGQFLPIEEMVALLVHSYPQENVFAYINDPHTMFFGASPERLFERKKNHITVDCIAGTLKFNSKETLFSEKLLNEHSFVIEFVKKSISPLCLNIKTSEISTKRAHNLIHLFQTVEGFLAPLTSDFTLIKALHPTPAVLGVPTDLSFSFIKKNETFRREFYGGCIGWIHKDKSRLKVAIRSGFVKKNKLSLYAGAGITKLSNEEEELAELDNKFQTLEEVFIEKQLSK